MNAVAAIAVTLLKAQTDEFKHYAKNVLSNASVLAQRLLDNQVQLGHNVQVGRSCLLCAHVGVAGSAVIGDRVVLGGKVGVADHLTPQQMKYFDLAEKDEAFAWLTG